MEDGDQYPNTRESFTDANGRTLFVLEVEPGERLGREIRGRMTDLEGSEHDYSIGQRYFKAIWVDHTITKDVEVGENIG